MAPHARRLRRLPHDASNPRPPHPLPLLPLARTHQRPAGSHYNVSVADPRLPVTARGLSHTPSPVLSVMGNAKLPANSISVSGRHRVRLGRHYRKPRISGTSPSDFTLWPRQLALRLRADLQSPRKIVPKDRPLEVLQSAENRRSNLICGAVPGCETNRSEEHTSE